MEKNQQSEQEVNKEQIDPETGAEQAAKVSEPESTPDSFETLTGSEDSSAEEIRKLKAELGDAKDKYLRMYSEFENFRRRTSREKLELIQSAGEKVLASMLPVLDDFERAEKAFREIEHKEAEGFLLIHNKLKKILEQSGVKEMDIQQGSDFDADFHEAISQVPAQSDELKGKVIDVVEKGYLLNEKVIRFAKVVVGN